MTFDIIVRPRLRAPRQLQGSSVPPAKGTARKLELIEAIGAVASAPNKKATDQVREHANRGMM